MPDYRILFSKSGRACYSSHLDLMRTFQRAFFRAGIPIRHTEGYNPHAFLSIVLPLPVGFSSVCEVLDFGSEVPLVPDEIPSALNAALPDGIAVQSCTDVFPPAKSLFSVRTEVVLCYPGGYLEGVPEFVEEIYALFSRPELLVKKKSKKSKTGETTVDILPLILSLDAAVRGDSVVLDACVRAQNPGLNPSLIVAALEGAYPNRVPKFVSYHRREVGFSP